jgi:hypothetical protein
MRKRWRTRRALERRQEDDARGPLDPTDGAALAGQHATPDRAPVSLARQNSEAVTGVYDEGRAAFGPPFFIWDGGTIGSPRRVRTRRAVIAWLLKMYAI